METIEITSLEGNTQKLDGGAMFGNAPYAMWSKWMKHDDLFRIRLACRSLLLEIKGKNVLFETGIGAFFEPKMATRFGVESHEHILLASLAKSGLTHEDIHYVILSHLHFDHAGGLLPAYGSDSDSLLFPNAEIVVGETAWQRALAPHPRDRASFVPQIIDPLKSCDRLTVVSNPSEFLLLDGRISFFESHGHTPGQLHSVIHGNERKVVFAGDLIPGVPWVNVPVTMGYDRYPEKLIDEKRELYERIDLDQDLIFFTHDLDTAAATVSFDGKRYGAGLRNQELKKMSI